MWIICLYSSCYQVQVKQFDTRELLSLHHLFSTHRKSTNQGSRKHTWSSICPGVISVLKTGISSTDIRGNESSDIRGKQSTDICGVDAMCSWCRRSLLEWLESVQDRFRNLKNIQCIKKWSPIFLFVRVSLISTRLFWFMTCCIFKRPSLRLFRFKIDHFVSFCVSFMSRHDPNTVFIP